MIKCLHSISLNMMIELHRRLTGCLSVEWQKMNLKVTSLSVCLLHQKTILRIYEPCCVVCPATWARHERAVQKRWGRGKWVGSQRLSGLMVISQFHSSPLSDFYFWQLARCSAHALFNTNTSHYTAALNCCIAMALPVMYGLSCIVLTWIILEK